MIQKESWYKRFLAAYKQAKTEVKEKVHCHSGELEVAADAGEVPLEVILHLALCKRCRDELAMFGQLYEPILPKSTTRRYRQNQLARKRRNRAARVKKT